MNFFRNVSAVAAILALTAVGANAQSTNATDQDNKVGSQKSMDKSSMDKGSMDSKDGTKMSKDRNGASGATAADGTKDTGAPNLRGHSDMPTPSGK